MEIGVGHHADKTVLSLVRPAPIGEHARIAGGRQGRLEMLAIAMLYQIESDHAFEHRDLDKTAFAGRMALQQSRHDRHARHQAAGLVSRDRRGVCR